MTDIKRIIAYSTCSQMGYLVFCIGLSQFNVSCFIYLIMDFLNVYYLLGQDL